MATIEIEVKRQGKRCDKCRFLIFGNKCYLFLCDLIISGSAIFRSDKCMNAEIKEANNGKENGTGKSC